MPYLDSNDSPSLDNRIRTSDSSVFKASSVKYQFGNYSGTYCGLQTLQNVSDVRLTVFLRHAYLFKDKDVLDIGCNVGHMTIAVAQRLHPKSILGIDIDKNLIARARQNLSNFQRIPASALHIKYKNKLRSNENMNLNAILEKDKLTKRTKILVKTREREKHEINCDYFPAAFPICFGSLPVFNRKPESPYSSPANNVNVKTSDQIYKDFGESSNSKNEEKNAIYQVENEGETEKQNKFPENVSFRTFNYAVTEELQMSSDKQQYDLILCLSLTKWIHLNCGDAGLKMTFRRMFNQLRPGGKLILEAQNWASYKKRKKLTVS